MKSVFSAKSKRTPNGSPHLAGSNFKLDSKHFREFNREIETKGEPVFGFNDAIPNDNEPINSDDDDYQNAVNIARDKWFKLYKAFMEPDRGGETKLTSPGKNSLLPYCDNKFFQQHY